MQGSTAKDEVWEKVGPMTMAVIPAPAQKTVSCVPASIVQETAVATMPRVIPGRPAMAAIHAPAQKKDESNVQQCSVPITAEEERWANVGTMRTVATPAVAQKRVSSAPVAAALPQAKPSLAATSPENVPSPRTPVVQFAAFPN